jgi:hypothetical protein
MRHAAQEHTRYCRAAALVLALTPLMTGDLATAQQPERRAEQLVLRMPEDPTRLQVDTSLSVTERAVVDFGGFYSFTFLNNQDSDGNSRRLLQYDTTLYGRASLDNVHTLYGRARFRYRDFSPGDSYNGKGDQWVEPFIDRYWYEFDLRSARAAYGGKRSENNLNVRVGRQYVDWGAGLVLSEVLLATRPTVSLGRLSIEGLAGVTPANDETIIDFDASRADYDTDTSRGFFGGMVRYTGRRNRTIYAYYLKEQDYNDDNEPRLDLGIPVDFTYDADYAGIGSTGGLGANMLYESELVYEWGTSTSDPLRSEQTEEDISAFAARGQLTWLVADARQTQVELETIFASGDPDRLVSTDTVGGNLAGTNDHGFNSLGLANTGLAFAGSLSNLMVGRVGASTFPLVSVGEAGNAGPGNRLQIGADLLVFGKMSEAGGIDEPTFDRTYLGFETDLYMNFRVFSDLAVTVRYGAFFPGSAIDGDSSVRNFIQVSVTLSF